MTSCPRCGAPLPADGSPCPRCLMELAISVDPNAETTALPPEEPPPDLGTVGPYRLLTVLGEGGMGTVYLAEQREPIQRRVALKLVRAGLAGKEALARFEAERQALALMTHPGIARVLDAGTTAEGAPYFVMEYVHGEPINAYCDRKRLSTAERIELFRAVCAAVQHAHQRGILHRDLKPSNILVEDVDGEPRPRIIDFGLAKALNQRLTERTLFTERGAIVGTPEYMSPEQAAGEAFDVDTTTDVYSLGVVLYELLTGSLPHDPQRLREAGWFGMMKILREEEPKRPSTRVSTLNDESVSEVAKNRRTEPRTLTRSLSGDIDWILLKALDKERERRYPNVSDLAADLERHLASEPVAASPPSAAYRVQKFVRRHRWGVAAALSLFVVGTLGLTSTLVYFLRSRDAQRQAAFELERNRLQLEFADAAGSLDSRRILNVYAKLSKWTSRSTLPAGHKALIAVQNLTALASSQCGSLFPGGCGAVRDAFASLAPQVEHGPQNRAAGSTLAAVRLAILACRYDLDNDWSTTERLIPAVRNESRNTPVERRLAAELADCAGRLPLLRSEWLIAHDRLAEAAAEARRGLENIERRAADRVAPLLLEARLQVVRSTPSAEDRNALSASLPSLCAEASRITDLDLFRPISSRVVELRDRCREPLPKSTDAAAAAARAVHETALAASAFCGGRYTRDCVPVRPLFAAAYGEVEALHRVNALDAKPLAARLAIASCSTRIDDTWERTERLLEIGLPARERLEYELGSEPRLSECALRAPVLRSRYLLGQGDVAGAEARAAEAVALIDRFHLPNEALIEPSALFQLARCRVQQRPSTETLVFLDRACAGLEALNGSTDAETRACFDVLHTTNLALSQGSLGKNAARERGAS